MYINGLKYACSTCIKGHRSSHCSHVDRPLFEIRKKGRPVTQCTFCRDLRKTKQVHIKCACTDKKANDNGQPQPLLIYRDSGSPNSFSTASPIASDMIDTCQDKNHHLHQANSGQCTCPSTAKTTTPPSLAHPNTYQDTPNTTTTATTTITATNASPTTTTASQPQVTSSLLAPHCPTKEENLSYSWALITSPSSNQIDLPSSTTEAESNHLFTDMLMEGSDEQQQDHNNLHLGFIFHKPTSQRFLDGQPRARRRRSNKQRPSPHAVPSNRLPANALVDSAFAINTMNDYVSTPPSSAVSPHPPSSNSSSAAACDPMDVQFDYLTEQLEILSNNENSNNHLMGNFSNADELTAILNNVLKEEEVESVSTQSHRSSISTIDSMPVVPQPTMQSQCGSFMPRSACCKSPVSNGESVVITITPLSTAATADKQQNYPTTTRIVTCYCGNQCSCPGCLVHPGNFFLGNDPYAGPLVPSSSASSSCYGSDEEDLSATITAPSSLAFNNSTTNYIPFQ